MSGSLVYWQITLINLQRNHYYWSLMGSESHLLRLYIGVFQPSVVFDQNISVKEGENQFENKICRGIFCRPLQWNEFLSVVSCSIFLPLNKIQLIFLKFLSFVFLSSIFTSGRVDVDQRAEKERQWRRRELPRQFTNAANARALVPKMAKTNQI